MKNYVKPVIDIWKVQNINVLLTSDGDNSWGIGEMPIE